MKHTQDGLLCDKCNSPLKYNYKYDAYYCQQCDTWAEEKCDDDTCEFCASRPEKPSMAVNS